MTAEMPATSNGRPTPPPSGPTKPSPTAELTALAAHLRRLADRVNDLDARCNDLAAAVTGDVLPQLAEHTTQVRQLIDTVTRDSDGPVNWPAMDAERASIEWDRLADWMARTLVPWYEITRDDLPDCWPLHRPAVVQLAWLHDTYRAAYRSGTEPHLSAEWHTRWLPAVLRALHDVIPRRGTRRCGPGQHLVSEADQMRQHPGPPAPPKLPTVPVPLPSSQLAERSNWQHFYDQAKTADIALRQAST